MGKNTQYQHYCNKCFEDHNKACGYCLMPDCGGKMVSYHQMLKLKAKAEVDALLRDNPESLEPMSGIVELPALKAISQKEEA